MIAVLALCAAGAAGWAARAATEPDHDVTVVSTFVGTVSKLNLEKDAGCIAPSNGGRAVCSSIVVIGGGGIVEGQRVRTAHEKAHITDDSGYDFLLVYPEDVG